MFKQIFNLISSDTEVDDVSHWIRVVAKGTHVCFITQYFNFILNSDH